MGGIDIDSYLCSGCATCVVLCPEVFRLSPITGKAELIDPDQPVTDPVREASSCPGRTPRPDPDPAESPFFLCLPPGPV